MSYLLISPDGAAALRSAMRQPVTAEQLTQFEARAAKAYASPDNMRVVDGVAEIAISGILTERPDFFAQYFGGGNTTYASIRSSLRMAEADPAVKEVLLTIASPGGTVDGLFETLAVLEAFSKPLRAHASTACSAAYAIASMCGSIQAATVVSAFGSIGVAVSLYLDDAVVDLTNTESPDKRPDASTSEGKAVIQAELDAIFEHFAAAIARGRRTTSARVTSDFGRGRTLLTDAAKAAGMIDSMVAAPRRRTQASANPSESLAELLATRLPEETSEEYVRRCVALLDRTPAVASAPAARAHTADELAEAVAALGSGMPAAFPLGLPQAGAEEVLDGLQALPGADAVNLESDVDPKALSLAVERARSLDWGLAG